MPLKSGSSPKVVSQNIREFHTGKTYAHTQEKFGKEKADKQAVAVALSNARRHGMASGGNPNYPPWYVRSEARSLTSPSGMIHSSIPGRTDKLPMNVAAGSYILPADIPSALGQGNSLAGGKILSKMFTSGPYGLPTMKGGKGGSSGRLPKMGRMFDAGGPAKPPKIKIQPEGLGRSIPSSGGSSTSGPKFPGYYDASNPDQKGTDYADGGDVASFHRRFGRWLNPTIDLSKRKKPVTLDYTGSGPFDDSPTVAASNRIIAPLHEMIMQEGGNKSPHEEVFPGQADMTRKLVYPPPEQGSAKGGKAGGHVPIIAAGGEYVIHPDTVMQIGGGNIDHGHRILDAFVKHIRDKHIKTLKKLPGPKK